MTSTATASATPSSAAPDLAGTEPTQNAATAVVGPVADLALASAPAGHTAEAAAAGVVTFYRLRGNGSARHLPYLAPDSAEREVAEWFTEQYEAGASVSALARETGVSRATVRRALAAVELADDIELGYYDDLVTDDVDAVFLAADDSDDADDEGQA
jgi:hypothetical protein